MNKILVTTALALAATAFVIPTQTADAQPGHYAEPPPPGPAPYVAPAVRRGLTLGFDVGLGGMEAASGPLCDACEEQTAGALGFWIGAMINPRFALMFQGSVTGVALDENGDQTLMNSTGLLAAKLWVSRRFWLKAGLGFAQLSISDDREDGVIDEGGAGMLGVGFEAIHAPRFSMDVSLTLTTSSYEAIDEEISSGILNLGFNWY